jgi:hypothetical protein
MAKKPEWLIDLGDDKYKVICKHGEYIMEEKDGETFEACKILSQKTDGAISLERALVMRSIIEPKIDETQFGKKKGSDYLKLQAAIVFIYELDDFLQKEE